VNLRPGKFSVAALGGVLLHASARAAETSLAPAAGASLTGVGFSLVRLFGGFVLVIAVFLGGVWLFKHWQRLAVTRGRAPKLNLLEVKSLGNRHALYVVAYEQQRLLIASSPAGVTLLTHLPEGDAAEAASAVVAPNFARALQQVLTAKS
jgi:flagellar biogenesis protein FliO